MQRLLVLFAVFALVFPVSAVSSDEVEAELYEASGAAELEDGLGSTERELLGGVSVTENGGFLHEVQALLSRALLHGTDYLHEAVRMAAMALAVCLICGICTVFEEAPQALRLAGALGLATVCFGGVGNLIAAARETVESLALFSASLLPALSAVAVSSGAIAAAPAIYGVTVLFADLLFGCITRLLIPMLCIFLALSLANTALGGNLLRQMCTALGWLIRTALKAILYAFTAFLSITQVISGTTDALSARAAKAALSSAVPVIGSIISDASDTLLASAGLLKNSIGIFGMLGILAIAVLPFLRIGISYLVMKLCGGLAGIISGDAMPEMIGAIAETLGLLLAMTGTCALLLLISAACSLKAVGF